MSETDRLKWLVLAAILGMTQAISITSLVQNKTVGTGESVQFICSVRDQQRHTVRWWFVNHNQQLSRDAELLSDAALKYSIIRPHDSDGVYVLHISNVQTADVGHYKCDIEDTNLQQVHTLTIKDMVQPRPISDSIPHVNYTKCCLSASVGSACLPVCSPTTLDLNTFNINVCAMDFPKVLKCGADGSNHLPCCRRRRVPTQCLGMCLGVVPDILDQTHSVCLRRAADILSCYEEGYHLLPGPPSSLSVYAVARSIIITWKKPSKNADSVTGYRVFYREIDYDYEYRSTAILHDTTYVLTPVEASTTYSVYVIALNPHGSSLPSYSVEISTASPATPPDQIPQRPPISASELIQCCAHRGITDKCQPFLCHGEMTVNMMPPECLLQMDKLLICLSGERNHSSCCMRRDIPAQCLPICSGAPSGVTFDLLACLPAVMPQIVSCFIEGQGLIPGAPRRLTETAVTSTTCDLQWDSPTNASLVVKYLVEFRKKIDGGAFSKLITHDTKTTLLDLQPDTVYEVQVMSIGANGTSLPSVRLVFSTYPIPTVNPQPTTTMKPTETQYNVTACCAQDKVSTQCLTFCSYKADFYPSSLTSAVMCIQYLPTALRCGADNRDHSRCCRRSGISRHCLKFCALSQEQANAYVVSYNDQQCVSQMGRIVNCMREGIDKIPSPPHSLLISNVTENTMTIHWQPPAKLSNLVIGYLVQYQSARQRNSWIPKNTKKLTVILQNLRSNEAYEIRVSAYNDDGESLPSETVTQSTLQPYKAVNFTPAVNVEECCREKNVSEVCMPGCRTQTVLNQHECDTSLPSMLQCAANDRDHVACCIRESIHRSCLDLCQGRPIDTNSISILCASHTQQLLSCFHEGMPTLPSPPRFLVLKDVTTRSVRLEWQPPATNANDAIYMLHYEWRSASQHFDKEEHWISQVTSPYLVTNLLASTQYKFFLTACNDHGCSAPSSGITITTIAVEAPVVTISQTPTGVIPEGSDLVTLSCSATGSPTPQVYWMRRQLRYNTSELRRTGITRVDAGRYTCIARNTLGATDSKDLYLQVSYRPSVEVPYPSVRVPDTGRLTAELACHFHGQPSSIRWTKDGQSIQLNGDDNHMLTTHYLEPDTGVTRSRLSIMLVTAADYGTYTCNGTNSFDSASGVIELTGLDGAPVTPGNEKDSVAACCARKNVHEKCRVACSFDVDLTAINSPRDCLQDLGKIIDCAADGKDHRKCCRQKEVPFDCLPICAGQSGNLTVNAITCMMHISAISNCMEQGRDNKPGKPINVHVRAVNGMLLVTWTHPKENADKVQFYLITYVNRDTHVHHLARVTADKTAVNLTKIYSLTEYWVNVTAGNHHILGTPSRTIIITTPESAPSAPSLLTGNLTYGIHVHLEWRPPVFNPGAVLYYIVFYTHVSDNVTKNVVLKSSQLSTDVTVLQVETEYTFYVIAQSSHHRSASSNVITIHTQVPGGYPSAHKMKGSTKVGLGIGVTFLIGVVLVIGGFVAFWFLRLRKVPQTQFKDTVAFENPGYARSNGPQLSGLPIDASGETSSNGISSTDDYASLSFDVAGQKNTQTYATLKTEADIENSYDNM